eukprot:COSAG02_NODE_2363_length_9059_cov_7.474219_11_plen_54_part_00
MIKISAMLQSTVYVSAPAAFPAPCSAYVSVDCWLLLVVEPVVQLLVLVLVLLL